MTVVLLRVSSIFIFISINRQVHLKSVLICEGKGYNPPLSLISHLPEASFIKYFFMHSPFSYAQEDAINACFLCQDAITYRILMEFSKCFGSCRQIYIVARLVTFLGDEAIGSFIVWGVMSLLLRYVIFNNVLYHCS